MIKREYDKKVSLRNTSPPAYSTTKKNYLWGDPRKPGVQGHKKEQELLCHWEILVLKEEDDYDVLVSRDTNDYLHTIINTVDQDPEIHIELVQ